MIFAIKKSFYLYFKGQEKLTVMFYLEAVEHEVVGRQIFVKKARKRGFLLHELH